MKLPQEIDILARELGLLEEKAGQQGWGGEFREEMFDLLLSYFTIWKGKRSLGSLMDFLCSHAQGWF